MSKIKPKIKIICLWLALLLLCCCGQKPTEDNRWPAETEGYTFTAPPGRVASLSPALTETLYMLGYGGRLVGVSDFCELPDAAEKLPECGSALLPDIERLKKLSPELLFCSAKLSDYDTARLEEAGVQVVVIPPAGTVDEILVGCRIIAAAFEGNEKADLRVRELASFFEATLDYIADEVGSQIEKGETSAIYLRRMPFTMATGDSLEAALLKTAGFYNPAAEHSGWSFPSDESEELAPDYIFCDLSIEPEDLQNSDYYKSCPAVIEERIYRFDARLFERRSPRLLFAFEQLMRDAFPEAFERPKPDFVLKLEPPPEPEKTWWEKLLFK